VEWAKRKRRGGLRELLSGLVCRDPFGKLRAGSSIVSFALRTTTSLRMTKGWEWIRKREKT
jgi:hypothetical protein